MCSTNRLANLRSILAIKLRFFSPLKSRHLSYSRFFLVTYGTVRSVHTCVNPLLRPAKMVALFGPSRSLAHCRRSPPRFSRSSSPSLLLFSFFICLSILVFLKWLHLWRHTHAVHSEEVRTASKRSIRLPWHSSFCLVRFRIHITL